LGKTKQNNYSFLHVQYRCEAFNQDFKEAEGHGEGGPILAAAADSKPIYLFKKTKIAAPIVYSSIADPCYFGVDTDQRIHASDYWIRIRMRVRILLFSSLTFKIPTKNSFFSFSAYYFLNVHLHHFSKIKNQKKVTFKFFLNIFAW
jgi:hypothetical protein